MHWESRARTSAALEAVDKELAALRADKVWREDEPMEREAAKRLHPDAHFAALHSIVGIKNAESKDPADHKHKARWVLGGGAAERSASAGRCSPFWL